MTHEASPGETGQEQGTPFEQGLGHVHTPLCGDTGRIVVGVDRSGASVAALRWAGQEALIRGTHLHVVHAWEPPARREEAERVVRDVLERAFRDLPVVVESLTVQGRAAETLTAAAHGAALVTVGSHVAGAFARVVRSVARRTAAFATCPVAVVREGRGGPPRFATVAVGVDDSYTSRDALRWAAEEARHRHALLKVVHPLAPLPRALPWATGYRAGMMIGYQLSEILAGQLAGVEVKVLTDPCEPHLPEASRVTMPLARTLISASEHADLLVVGAHGYGSVSGALTGSVTSDCLRAAACPVVIVPGAREDRRHRVREARLAMERESSERGPGATIYPPAGRPAPVPSPAPSARGTHPSR